MIFRILAFCGLFLWAVLDLNAQPEPMLQTSADTVLVASSMGLQRAQQGLDSADLSVYKTENLGQLLAQKSHFYLKEYGLGTLATVSNRGGSASQTQLLWEGVNIQNPMLGQADYNLIPNFLLEKVQVYNQASSGFIGSAGVGGAVFLSGAKPSQTGWTASAGSYAGSFGRYQQGLSLAFLSKSGAKIQHWHKLKSYQQQAENDFCYRDLNAFGGQKPWKKQQNAQMRQFHGLHEHFLAFGAYQISLKGWHLRSWRALPPSLLQSNGYEQQQDQSSRWVLDQQLKAGNGQTWRLKHSYISERLHYQSQSISADSRFSQQLQQLRHQWVLPHNQLLVNSLEYTRLQAQSEGYSQNAGQNRLALGSFYQYMPASGLAKWALVARLERLQTNRFFYSLAASGDYQPNPNQHWGWNVGKNYRLPTFNDWFWAVGGNPQLRAEQSWQSQAYFQQQGGFYRVKISAYGNFIRDYISWQPDDRTSVWAVFNLNQVINRGIQSELSLDLYQNRQKRLKMSLTQLYAYTRSSQNGWKGQLLYVPAHKYELGWEFWASGWQLRYQHSVGSRRYVDNSLQNSLPWYQLAHLRLGYNQHINGASVQIFAQVHNLYNAEYQLIANRAMPPTWWEFGLEWSR